MWYPRLLILQAAAEDMRQAELRRAQSRLQSLTPAQQAAVEAATRGLMNKFLHQPLQALKAAAREGDLPPSMPSARRSGLNGSQGSRGAFRTRINAEPAAASNEPALL